MCQPRLGCVANTLSREGRRWGIELDLTDVKWAGGIL